jgi:methylenetetrahydrofolate dehydrogenase (NADP+)/methenyltetrahydrofolate cyclohydrolase
MIVDGKQLAADRREEVARERAVFDALSLGVIIVTSDPVTQSYVRIKKRAAEALGIAVGEYVLPDTASFERVAAAVEEARQHDGIIVQLPLPKHIDTDTVKNLVPAALDVDVLSDMAFDAFAKQEISAVPPVPAAMHYVLKRNGVEVNGKRVVCVGRGRLVGRPASVLFKNLGADVVMLGRGDDVPAAAREADILILGAGVPHFIKPEMIREGAVILDGGTSESSGKVVGDADPACAEKAAVFTPVPGGIGPIAVVEIFANLVALKKSRGS